MKPLQICIPLLVVAFLTISLFGKAHKSRVKLRSEDYFYKVGFKGKLQSVYQKNGGVGIKLKDGFHYVFYPNAETGRTIVSELETYLPSNTIYKNNFSDTIYISSKGNTYFFISTSAKNGIK